MDSSVTREAFDLIVLGAGPAGSNAALTAAAEGLRVALIDDSPEPGGQVWRAPQTERARLLSDRDADRCAGEQLRDAVGAASITFYPNTTVWSVTPDFEVTACAPDGAVVLRAPRLVAAFGAVERIVPFPGWELPGVFGLAAATALMKRDGRLPGKRLAIAGRGPLLVAVAAKAIASGSTPGIVVDAARRGDWLRAGAGFSRSPVALARGLGWTARIASSRVQRRYGYGVVAAHGDGQLEAMDIATLGRDGVPDEDRCHRVEIDTLFVGDGLSPVAEVPRLLGAKLHFNALCGGFSVASDEFGRTSVSGLYAAGDGAGVRGAAMSECAGALAGIAAAADAGVLDVAKGRELTRHWTSRQQRHAPCADASCRLMCVPDARLAAVPHQTVICRCENVTRGTIDTAADNGAITLDELKHLTRLGMGPCQGRMCSENAAVLLALGSVANAGTGKVQRARSGTLTQRVPLKPVPIDDLTGSFSYDDIPVPSPAPL